LRGGVEPRFLYAQQFADSHDHPESAFYCAEARELDLVETWEHLVVGRTR
jgi:hypothetical protein